MKLTRSILDWSLLHIVAEGDTDLLPTPFESQVITKQWTQLRTQLASVDIIHHVWSGPRRLVVPKAEFAFRAVCQLAGLMPSEMKRKDAAGRNQAKPLRPARKRKLGTRCARRGEYRCAGPAEFFTLIRRLTATVLVAPVKPANTLGLLDVCCPGRSHQGNYPLVTVGEARAEASSAWPSTNSGFRSAMRISAKRKA
jgi:hypothetical protein